MDVVSFKKGFKTYLGIVVEPFDIPLVIYHNEKQLEMALLSEIKVEKGWRHWIYRARPDIYEQQRSVMLTLLDPDQKMLRDTLRGINPKISRNLAFIYLILARRVSFPTTFVDKKIVPQTLLSPDFGFIEIGVDL